MGQSVRGTRIGRRGHAAALCLHHLPLPGAFPWVPSTYRPHLTEFVRADTLPFAMVSFRGAPSELNMRVRLSLSLRPLLEEWPGILRVDLEAVVLVLYFVPSGFSQEPW